MTDDRRHAPVMVRGRFPYVGYLKLELAEATFAD
jgi:hypothetical protein